MAISQIVPFATAPGSNVQDLASYLAAASTASGFSAGVANSGALNRAWRQSSFMAAGLAGLLVNNGVNVPDDGDLAALVANIQGLFGTTTKSQKLPGGLILQWDVVTVPASGTAAFPLPMAFPSVFYGAIPALLGLTAEPAGSPFIGYSPSGLANITIRSNYSLSSVTVFYLAIGR